MGFNTLQFLLFFVAIFSVYWLLLNKKHKAQNLLILLASYTFYGFWDFRFLALIFISTVTDYLIGIYLDRTEGTKQRNFLLLVSLFVNLGLLFFFKYFGFFVGSWIDFWAHFDIYFHRPSIEVILPVGISFYTFQTLSYTIDIYRKELKPCKDFIIFSAFVSFFPQLMAGPIERAKDLIPQFERSRVFDYKEAVIGMRFIIWGLFKKVVIADQCALVVETIFSGHEELSGLAIFIGCLLYSVQIYADFSGYSEMAIGLARLLGFKLSINFAYPFFAENLPELWKRWHITLFSWYKDYIYVPLGGSRVSVFRHMFNLFTIFFLTGLWHGASYNKVVWGVLSGLFLIPNSLYKRLKGQQFYRKSGNGFFSGLKMFRTLILFSIPLIIFRCKTLDEAWALFGSLFTHNFIGRGLDSNTFPISLTIFLIFTFVFEWIDRDKFLATFDKIPSGVVRILFYNILLFSILSYSGAPQDFFYFQF